MNRLPKYWVVENDLTPKYKDIVIGYLNKECDVNYVGGSTRYYGYDGNKAGNGTNCDNSLKQFKNNPILLTLNEFIELSKPIDEFVVPDKWCVKCTKENYPVLDKWFYEKTKKHRLDSDKCSYWHYPEYCDGYCTYSEIWDGYKEITFEQFQKNVLKQDDMEKKIIGYNLINPEFEDAYLALCPIGNYPGRNMGLEADVLRKENIIALKKAGVLDLWFEPVYEEEYPNITINGYKGEFFNDYVKFGCAEIESKLFIALYNNLDKNYSTKYSKTNKQFESITIGKGTFTKEHIKQIAEYYLNKK